MRVLIACITALGIVGCTPTSAVVAGAGTALWVGTEYVYDTPPLDYVAEFQYTPFTTIEYEQVEGDLRLLEGRWQFDWRPEEQITLVTHEMRVRAKFPVPRWLLRRSLARDVTDLLHCLRAKAGGSGSTEQERYDLGYCPDL